MAKFVGYNNINYRNFMISVVCIFFILILGIFVCFNLNFKSDVEQSNTGTEDVYTYKDETGTKDLSFSWGDSVSVVEGSVSSYILNDDTSDTVEVVGARRATMKDSVTDGSREYLVVDFMISSNNDKGFSYNDISDRIKFYQGGTLLNSETVTDISNCDESFKLNLDESCAKACVQVSVPVLLVDTHLPVDVNVYETDLVTLIGTTTFKL